MTTKLYYHQTDGGAEYLCASPVEGTDEGDLYTAVIRLDGEPELIRPIVSPELLEAFSNLEAMCNMPEIRQAMMKHNQSYYHTTMYAARIAIKKARGE